MPSHTKFVFLLPYSLFTLIWYNLWGCRDISRTRASQSQHFPDQAWLLPMHKIPLGKPLTCPRSQVAQVCQPSASIAHTDFVHRTQQDIIFLRYEKVPAGMLLLRNIPYPFWLKTAYLCTLCANWTLQTCVADSTWQSGRSLRHLCAWLSPRHCHPGLQSQGLASLKVSCPIVLRMLIRALGACYSPLRTSRMGSWTSSRD